MELHVAFQRFIKRNDKSGKSRFVVKDIQGNRITVDGYVSYYPKDIPLKLDGEYDDHVFVASDINVEDNRPFTKLFLGGGYFQNMKEKTAEAFLQIIGNDDLFEISLTDDVTELFEKYHLTQQVYQAVLRRINHLMYFEKLYAYIRSFEEKESSYAVAYKIYDRFDTSSLAVLESNPYVLMYCGMTFEVCEKIAKAKEIPYYDRRRVKMLVEHICLQNHKNGNTRIGFGEICRRAKYIEDKIGSDQYTDSLFIGEEILSDRYVTEAENGEVFVYLKEDYAVENEIVKQLKRLRLSSRPIIPNIDVQEIERECGIVYGKSQRDAFRLLNNSGIKVVYGGPGSGKTTLINGLIYTYWKNFPENKIALCAPMARAARRMKEVTGLPASTIHKLLKIRPYQTESDIYIEELEADLIIADEMSLADQKLFCWLLSAIKNGALVILVGDPNQLPSVEAGNILKDLIDSGRLETYYLDHVFRQDSKSLIVENSERVISGDCNIITDNHFIVRRFQNEQDLLNGVTSIARKVSLNENTRLFVPARNEKFATGSIRVNRQIQEIRGNAADHIEYGYYTFYIGDMVIFNSNNYDKNYFNGQDGILTDIQRHHGKILLTIESDGEEIHMTNCELDDLELAFAITAYKAQGGECNNAIIIVPQTPKSMLKRQLLYVEITRAKENVVILSEGDALEKAISSYMEIKRETGLSKKLLAS